MADILSHFLKINNGFFTGVLTFIGLITFLAGTLRYTPLVPELKFPLKTPFGKLPFFDGVFLYGIITLLLLGAAKGITLLALR